MASHVEGDLDEGARNVVDPVKREVREHEVQALVRKRKCFLVCPHLPQRGEAQVS